ncbi:MAG: hypothetical protein FWB86_00580 [Treponema sp.]|nr:hypothetical protein [Treponema sp.]MCL2250590.1 hypothetical protein [Treponema sp.]
MKNDKSIKKGTFTEQTGYTKAVRLWFTFSLFAIIFLSCSKPPEIIQKDYQYEKIILESHRFEFEFHLENIGNSGKINDLIKILIYADKNFDEYMEYREKKFIDNINLQGMSKEDDIDILFNYYLMENYSIVNHNESFIIIKYDDYFYYSGAAHGNYQTKYFIIDISEERLLNINDLINQIPDALLRSVIESEYNINYFLRQEIWSPDTINFSKGNIALIWNTYSITPYSNGIIQIEIPYAIIDQYLTDKSREIIKSFQ